MSNGINPAAGEQTARGEHVAARNLEIPVKERPIENLTLRELLRDAEVVGRELADHLERGFAPKTGDLALLICPKSDGELNHALEDGTLYHTIRQVLDSHQFTEILIARFRQLLKAIDRSVSRISA